MSGQSNTLRISLAEIAALTRVKRPVVSMWRRRSEDTETPFPEAVQLKGGQQLFDAGQVQDWLAATGHGNNPQAVQDMAAFARHDSSRTDPAAAFAATTALITLRRLNGGPLGELGTDDLLDAADENDPDDEFLYSEIENLGAAVVDFALRADQLVEAAYSPEAAFETLMRDRFRAGLRDHADTALAGAAIELAARAAVELSRNGGTEAPVFVDASSGGSDLLVAVVHTLPEDADPRLLTSNDGGQASRTALRRLLVHGARREHLQVTESGAFGVSEPAVHVASYPPPGAPGMRPAQMLAAIENTVLQMDDSQRGVVVAPAAALTDAVEDPAAVAVRSDLLRSGRVRAIVRLPSGLVPAKTRQALALWVLGPAHASVPIAERWTMVADLSGTALTADAVQDLVGDLAVSMESAATIRAHAMRFARVVPTSRLLASRGALVKPASGRGPGRDAAEQAVRADALLARLNAPSATPSGLPLAVSLGHGAPATASVEEQLSRGHLRYVKGARLLAALPATDDGGARVLGLPELGLAEASGTGAPGERRVDRLVLAANHPHARLSEPGDVVFATAPTPAAMVDVEGGSVVEYPARVLRISGADPGGLMPELLAADINAAASKNWRGWALRLVPHATAQQLRPVLDLLDQEEAAARLRLAQLTELTALLRDGVSAGSLVVDATIDLT
ncbi:hypothetical protein JOF48_001074 [Arthrobacter stackebrandtii]|uniref:DNA-binding protein n=1 Tax=Arthrobacter stackebrandtii TaxID=272161 RepID=A0ABS4YUK0_9MICC|nr:hypothetical protein [Arthrobacter stackebrandtii]MBP2412275.1 hypothetical protein [Arthrobacter stackebrandtii]PYH02057.1 hypothetical protein CVV67_01025 [Arthrobacter stackebrandtii]